MLAQGEAREARLEAAVASGRDELARRPRSAARARSTCSADRLVAIYRGGMPDTTTRAARGRRLRRPRDARRVSAPDRGGRRLARRARALACATPVAAQLAAVEDAEHRAAGVQRARSPPRATRSPRCAPTPRREAAALADAARSRAQAAVEEPAVAGRRLDRRGPAARADLRPRRPSSEVGDWFGDWAIPESIVMCESGGNCEAVNPSSGAGGAYQILPSTWDLYGGEGDPEDASPGRAVGDRGPDLGRLGRPAPGSARAEPRRVDPGSDSDRALIVLVDRSSGHRRLPSSGRHLGRVGGEFVARTA